MKQKGICELPPPGVRQHETTRSEQLKAITLRDGSGMSWAAIDRRLNIHKRIIQKVVLLTLTLKISSIDLDILQGERDWNSFELKTFIDAEKQELTAPVTRGRRA